MNFSQIFTKIDLCNAYHLVRIREGIEWKTAFNAPSGHYEYQVMPFRLTNTPAVFQTLVNDMLNKLFLYIDGILISLLMSLPMFSVAIWANQLFVKAEKCEFH